MFAVITNNPILQVGKPRLRNEQAPSPELNPEWAAEPGHKLSSSVSVHWPAVLYTQQYLISCHWCVYFALFQKGSKDAHNTWKKSGGRWKNKETKRDKGYKNRCREFHTICYKWASYLALRFPEANTKQRKTPVGVPSEHLVTETPQQRVRRRHCPAEYTGFSDSCQLRSSLCFLLLTCTLVSHYWVQISAPLPTA